jgi:hypothetical protein
MDLESLLPDWVREEPDPQTEEELNKNNQHLLHSFFMNIAKPAPRPGEEGSEPTEAQKATMKKVRRSHRGKKLDR